MSTKTITHFITLIKKSNFFSKKERNILIRRAKGDTLKKIGKRYKLTAERIRQIEEAALNKFTKRILQLNLFRET